MNLICLADCPYRNRYSFCEKKNVCIGVSGVCGERGKISYSRDGMMSYDIKDYDSNKREEVRILDAEYVDDFIKAEAECADEEVEKSGEEDCGIGSGEGKE